MIKYLMESKCLVIIVFRELNSPKTDTADWNSIGLFYMTEG